MLEPLLYTGSPRKSWPRTPQHLLVILITGITWGNLETKSDSLREPESSLWGMILIIRLSSMQKGVYRLSSKVTHPVSISKSLRVSNSSSTESNTKKKSKTKRTKPKLGFFSSAFADIRGRIATFQADWDEMNKNLAPIPSESPPESGWRKIWTE